MKLMNKLALIIAVLILLSSSSQMFGQEDLNKKSFGISALVQDGQYDIMIPILLSKSAVIAPAIGIVGVSDAGTDIGLGVVTRFYLNDSKVKPFLGGRAGVMIFSPSESEDSNEDSESTTDFILGFLAGGEYFLDEGFSFGVEAQLNASISDENSSRFGNPGGVNINTGAAVFATVYF
jgi:hypothetical protein